MPKLCIPCGRRDEDGCADTCPACGEGSWMTLGQAEAMLVDLEPVAVAPVSAEKPRRRGRR